MALLFLIFFIILDHSLDGILNGLLSSGLVMLMIAIFDLLKLNIIKISRQLKLICADNVPLIVALISYFFLNNLYNSIILNFYLLILFLSLFIYLRH